jgi:serine/threonine-protein kinase
VEPGLRIADKYDLLRLIGAGGMGEVWAAHHNRIDRNVAIKFPNVDLAQRPEIRERFLDEARVLGRLRHPNIVDVIDFGELDDGGLYLVFELLDGMSLDAYVQELGRLAPRNAVTIAVELCRGLAFAHGANVVHRDLKPANVFLHNTPNGRMQVKLLDFGISKTCSCEQRVSLTGADAVVGTPAYMSYEQAKALPDVDARSDIWNVGVILYEMLAGIPPFEAPTYSAAVAKIVEEAVPPLSTWGAVVPTELETIVQRCLAKNRDQRFQSALALQAALESVMPRLSEPPLSRRLQLDSLTDLPSIPPPPTFSIPSEPSSSLRVFSPCAVTGQRESVTSQSFRPTQVTPAPENVHPRAPRSRALALSLGVIALLGLGAGIATVTSRTLLADTPPMPDTRPGLSYPETVRAEQPPAITAKPVTSAIEPSASAVPTPPKPASPPKAPNPTRVDNAKPPTKPTADKPTTAKPPADKPTTDKPPATLVDDPGF